MTAHASRHRSRRWLVPLIATALVGTVGCTSAASPTPTSPSASAPTTSGPMRVAPSASPSATPAVASASPIPTAVVSATPAPSAQPGVALAPDGAWTRLRWQSLEKAIPLGPTDVSVHGWRDGYIALEQSSGSDNNGNELPVVIRASSSTDGVRWTKPTTLKSALKGMFRIESIVQGPAGLLALAFPYGDTCGGPEPLSAMWSSSDGVTWAQLPIPKAFQSGAVHTIAGGDAGFIALGAQGSGRDQAIWTSRDGRTWTANTLPTVASGTLALDDVASFDTGFVLVGSVLGEEGCGGAAHIRPATWFSTDGSAWTRTSLPGASTDKNAILRVRTLLGRLLVTQSLSSDETQLHGWTSTDGRTWAPAGPVAAETSWSAVSDGRHAVMVRYPDDGGVASVIGLDDRGRSINLALSGDGPVEAEGSVSPMAAVGPTGVLVLGVDGRRAWLGLPS